MAQGSLGGSTLITPAAPASLACGCWSLPPAALESPAVPVFTGSVGAVPLAPLMLGSPPLPTWPAVPASPSPSPSPASALLEPLPAPLLPEPPPAPLLSEPPPAPLPAADWSAEGDRCPSLAQAQAHATKPQQSNWQARIKIPPTGSRRLDPAQA